MARSDFVWVNFDVNFDVAGESATRNFVVDGAPIDTGYLLVQARGLNGGGAETLHQIEINGQDLPVFDLPVQEGNDRWTTWMDRIPPNFLLANQNNTITIRKVGADNFSVANVAIHWREN